jgi:phosphinothricin acetyltransferase
MRELTRLNEVSLYIIMLLKTINNLEVKMIRIAEETDLIGILEIYNDAILNTSAVYSYKANTLDERKDWYNKKIADGYPLLVFEENNLVVGFATFGPFRAWPAYKYSIEHSVYVHKEYRNKGIGIKLTQEIIKIANEQEYATLVAGIDAANEGSIKMHEKLSFKHAGTIKKAGFKFGKWLNLAFYQLDLVGPKMPVEG